MESIHDFICNRSYWGKGRTIEQVRKTLGHSICFGAYVDGNFSGFTRVVTDTVLFPAFMRVALQAALLLVTDIVAVLLLTDIAAVLLVRLDLAGVLLVWIELLGIKCGV